MLYQKYSTSPPPLICPQNLPPWNVLHVHVYVISLMQNYTIQFPLISQKLFPRRKFFLEIRSKVYTQYIKIAEL